MLTEKYKQHKQSIEWIKCASTYFNNASSIRRACLVFKRRYIFVSKCKKAEPKVVQLIKYGLVEYVWFI